MFYLFVFILGLAVGSFLNVVIDRLPRNEAITGRSHCDFCHKKLAWYDLIPVISFLFLKGRCRFCHKKLSPQYPLVELLTGLTFFTVLTVFKDLPLFSLLMYFGIFSCLIIIFFTDLKYHVISEVVLLTLLILSLFVHAQRSFPISNILLAGVVVMLPILILYLVTRGRGMGFGDVELAFVMGVLLGLKGGLVGIYIAFIVGGAVGVILLLIGKRKLKSHIAFGPFLILGTVIMFLYPTEIFQLISRFF